jgi:mannitol/fructose-specific phosphotransferase system IIA component (Ntr-type)
MTASRYPLGMSRDRLLPAVFQRIVPRFQTPWVAILFTGVFMIAAILFLPLELLVKIASSVLLLLFIFANITLILFRESRISSYRPKFRSPFYPYMQIIGIIGGVFLLVEMGTYILFLTMIFLFLGVAWYRIYAQKRASQDSALFYALEQLTAKDDNLASDNLLSELKEIVIQRDGLRKDRFYQLIEDADILDIEEPITMEDLFRNIGEILEGTLNVESQEVYKKFIERERESSTVIQKGLAIPHVVIEGVKSIKAVLVRARAGVIFPKDEIVHIMFVLIGSSGDRIVHLQVLAAIAQVTQQTDFNVKWLNAADESELRNLVLFADRKHTS